MKFVLLKVVILTILLLKVVLMKVVLLKVFLVVICRIFDPLNNKFNFTTGKSFPIEQSKCILNQEVGFSY